MALINNRPQRIVVLCMMYVAQGLPWGFMVTAIVAYLTDTDKSITGTEISALTAMTLLPWTFKLVWAPLIDTLTIRSMGRRRPWIIGAQCMMAVTLVAMLSAGDLVKANIVALGWWFFIHNCFASLQDVATDALAIDVLPTDEHGKVNGLMWGSKLFGKGVGAGVSGWILVHHGFESAVWTQFGFLILIMMFPLFCRERPGEKLLPWTSGSAKTQDGESSVRSLADVMRDLVTGFSLPSTLVFAFFGVFAVIGWGIVEVATKPLYTQDLEWTSEQYSFVSGWAVAVELFGALLGGWIADRYDRRWVMTLGFGAYGILAIIFAACPELWNNETFSTGYLFLAPGAIAMGAVGYNSMGMRVSWTKASATMFTLYMTLSNVGHVVGNYTYGVLRDDNGYSYETIFYVAGAAMLVPLLALPLIKPRTIDDRIADLEHNET
jgi:MFS transporter, PAT family, beta-lactamase induction signal transducer AmpG